MCSLTMYGVKLCKLRRTSTLALRQRKAARLRPLSVPADLLRASGVERFTTCGKPNCVRVRGQRHGPSDYLTAHLGPGHITTLLLQTAGQQQAAEQGVRGYQDHGEQLEQWSQINSELLRRGEPLDGSVR